MAGLIGFTQIPLVRHAAMGALGGLIVAIRADRETFNRWTTWQDIETFDWSVASFRYLKGATIGALTVSGIGGLIG